MSFLSPAAQKAQRQADTRSRIWQATIGLSDSGQWFYVAHALRNRKDQRQQLAAQMQAAGFRWDSRPTFRRFWRRATAETAAALAEALTLKDRAGQPVLHCWHAAVTKDARRKLEQLLQPPGTRDRDQAIPVGYSRGRSKLFKEATIIYLVA